MWRWGSLKVNPMIWLQVTVPWCLLHSRSTIHGTSAGTLKSLFPKSWGSPTWRAKAWMWTSNSCDFWSFEKQMIFACKKIPSKLGFNNSRRFLVNKAFEYKRSKQHNSKWYEFTKSSLIAGKWPVDKVQDMLSLQK